MINEPIVSIILPTYNNGEYLGIAIESILTQTYPNFELIIVDDGSTDNSQEIINSYKDNRIINIKNEFNVGLINSLNKGLILARGKYIARMDGDDYCYRKRLEIQINYLEKHPETILLGGSHYTGNIESNKIRKQFFPCDTSDIRALMLFNCPFSHITVMFRNETIKKFQLKYDELYKYAEDYELWLKMSDYGEIKNLPYFFCKYRFNSKGQTATANKDYEQRYKVISDIQSRCFKKLNYNLNEKEKKMVFDVSENQRIINMFLDDIFIKELIELYNKLIIQNRISNYTESKSLKKISGFILLKILYYRHKDLNIISHFRIFFSKYFFWGIVYAITPYIKKYKKAV
jgi:glycosyltransferase involved in cell wall biosynthesis